MAVAEVMAVAAAPVAAETAEAPVAAAEAAEAPVGTSLRASRRSSSSQLCTPSSTMALTVAAEAEEAAVREAAASEAPEASAAGEEEAGGGSCPRRWVRTAWAATVPVRPACQTTSTKSASGPNYSDGVGTLVSRTLRCLASLLASATSRTARANS